MNDTYNSPFSSRYASKKMQELFSPQYKYQTFRKLWYSLAKAQHELGLRVTEAQVNELKEHLEDIDFNVVADKEKEIKHDVSAHIYAYGLVAPNAKSIIHLGATSCYVTDNTDLIIYKEALIYTKNLLLGVMSYLCDFIEETKSIPTLGYTHYQPAQLVTVGKRASLWLQDFLTDLEEINFCLTQIKFLGCRGTTGTEASFMELFNNDETKIDEMNKKIASDFGFEETFDVCGQNYPRKLDYRILSSLSSISQSCYKLANDIRLLQHDNQLQEPFSSNQVGSSAMPYKRNPMRCERICSLSRYLQSNTLNASMTSSTQFLERSLDDSAIRRISLPEGFLCVDSILHLTQNVISGLEVNTKVIEASVKDYLPFIATENIMMEACKKGADRQVVHKIIRDVTIEESNKLKEDQKIDLLKELLKYKELKLNKKEIKDILNPALYIGRSATQAQNLVNKIRPLLKGAILEADEIKL